MSQLSMAEGGSGSTSGEGSFFVGTSVIRRALVGVRVNNDHWKKLFGRVSGLEFSPEGDISLVGA